jgi:hypothetical protein
MKHLLILLVFFADMACADILPEAGGRLLATGGVTQIEGAGGGGLVPWALISGYGTRDQVGLTVFYTQADTSDCRLSSAGVAVGIYDRVEIFLAQQRLGLGTTVPGQSIDQNMLGIKLKVLGDAIFDRDRWWPQVAVGAIYKHNEDMAVPRLLGAKRDADTDIYHIGNQGLSRGRVRAQPVAERDGARDAVQSTGPARLRWRQERPLRSDG